MTADDIVPAFLAACPGLSAPWAEYLTSWEGHTDRGVYNDTAVIADFLVERYAAGDHAEFPAAFAALEKCLAEGDEQAREVTTIGIVEGIQTIASHFPFGPEAFEPWLRPRSRVAWVIGAASWSCEWAFADTGRELLRLPEPPAVWSDLSGVQSAGLREMVARLFRG